MIDFAQYNSYGSYGYDREKVQQELDGHLDQIREDLRRYSSNRFWIGVHLIELYRSHSYKVKSSDVFGSNCSAENFFFVCKTELDLDKSQVSRLMNVVDEFGAISPESKDWTGYREEYKEFSYAVLVEMLPLTEEERKPIDPHWTREQVRAYKKSLVAPAQQEDDQQSAEKPKDEFPQYKDWNRRDLCKRIVTLEDENKKLKEQLAEYEKYEDVPLVDLLDELPA